MTKRNKKTYHKEQNLEKWAKIKELNSIKTLIDSGKLSKGYAELAKYVERYPEDPYGHYLYGKCFLDNNELDCAQKEFEIVAKQDSKKRHSGLISLARVYWLKGDKDSAREYYNEAIEDNPYGSLLVYLCLAELENEDKNYYSALNILYRALDVEPVKGHSEVSITHDDVRLRIAKNLLALGDYSAASLMVESIVASNPTLERELYFLKAEINKSQENYEQAIPYLEMVRVSEENDKIYYQATMTLAMVYKQLGKISEEIACLEELQQNTICPYDDVPLLLGMALIANKDYAKAKAAFKTGLDARDFNVKNQSAYYYSALQLLEKDNTGAIITLKKVIDNQTTPYRINYISLIRALYNQGNYEEARHYIEKIGHISPNNEDNYSFIRLQLLLDKAQGLPLPNREKKPYIDRQFIAYDLDEAIDLVTNNHLKNTFGNSAFPSNTDIRQVFEDVKPFLVEENKLLDNIVDEYEVFYPNAGYYEGRVYNHLRVKTIPGTTQILSLYPSEESFLPTKGALKETLGYEKRKESSRIERFNRRFAKQQNL